MDHSVAREERRGIYHQLLWENSTIDEDFELAGFDLSVAPLDSKGIIQAQSTRDG